MKRFNLLIWLVALACLAGLVRPQAAAAQTAAPSMTATAAFDGNFKYGEWLPLYVDLENKGGDVEAEVRVRVTSSSGNTVFAAPVSLPAGAHKLVPLYILPNNFSRALDVQLISQGKLLVSQQVKVRPQPNITYLVGFIAAQRGALALMNGMVLPGPERAKVLVDLGLTDLPERLEGLASFDTLVINDVDTSSLTPQQAAVLQSWVERGGRLVIGGGAGAQRTLAGLPPALLPVKLDGTQEVKTDDLADLAKFASAEAMRMPGPFVAAKGNADGSRLLAGKADLPLVVERSVNKGALDFVALDLSAAPFDGWPAAQVFWSALLSPGAAYPDGMPPDASVRQMRTSGFYGALMNIPSLDLPSVRGLSILLGLYILLVGPVNYFVLKRNRRLHLAWVTIPVITVLFTGGAFAIGYALRGSDLILNKVAVVEVQNEGPALVTSYMGLFSPSQKSYEIEVQANSLLSPAQPGFGGQEMPGMTGGPEVVFYQGRPSVVQGLSVGQFSMQSFMAEDTWPDFGKISGKLHMENDTLTGTVKNETRFPLKDVVIVLSRRFQRLGDLAPGQEVRVSLGLADLNHDMMGPNLSYRLYMEQFNNNNGRVPRDIMLKTNILDNTLEGAPWSKTGSSDMTAKTSGGTRSIIVLGWADQAPPQVTVRGQALAQTTTTFVYTNLQLEMPENGRLTLPPGMLSGRIVNAPAGMGSCGPSGSPSIYLDNAEAAFEFQLPQQINQFKVTGLKVAVAHDNPNAAFKNLAVYDWQGQKWVLVDTARGESVLLQNAGPYIGSNGQVRVRISANSGNASCYFLDLGIEADRLAGQGGG